MTAPQGPTVLTLSGIVDGQEIDAADVTTPLSEAAAAIDEARQTVAVSSDDAVLKYLSEALVAGSGISLTVEDTGGSKTIRITASSVATGVMQPWFGSPYNIPAGYLICDGRLVSMSDYKALLDLFIEGTSAYGLTVQSQLGLDTGVTFTADIATDKLLASGHGLSDGTVIMLSNSGGALPAGLATNTAYWVINAAANDFQVSLTQGGAPVDITSDGSGTHRWHASYRVPDLRGRALIGMDAMLAGASANRVTAAAADQLGGSGGAETHTLSSAEVPPIPPHTHTAKSYSAGGGSNKAFNIRVDGGGSVIWETDLISGGGGAGSAQAHNNMQPYMAVLWIIKT